MSLDQVAGLAVRRAADVVWIDERGSRTWADLGAAVDRAERDCRAAGVRPGEIVVTPGSGSFAALAWLGGVARVGAVAAPLRPEREPELAAWTHACTIAWHVRDDRLQPRREGVESDSARGLIGELRARGRPGLLLGTGGTTGNPRLVLHDLSALLATLPLRTGASRRILPLMRFDHIGGIDVTWRALAGGQTLVAPPPEISPLAVAATIARHAVEVMPATPTFLNLMLLAEVERTHDLRSLRLVPHGAEPMPAGLLARLRAALPGTEFVPRFGTTETGVLPVRADGDAFVLLPEAGFAWRVVEGELWIRSPARALGYLSGAPGGFSGSDWFRTGDLAVERPDGAIAILGRRSDLINVGGEKVLPGTVESALLTHPEIADCRVFSRPNPLLGEVVAAEIVWRGAERDAVEVRRQLHAHLGATLPKCHLPTVVRLVSAIYTNPNFKRMRTTQ